MSSADERDLNTLSDSVVVSSYYNEYYGSEEEESWGKLVTELSGRTKELVLAKLGKAEGVVTIVEEHWNSGYCETCSFAETDFDILVDGEMVWSTRSEGYAIKYEAPELTTFAVLQSWLESSDEEVN